MTNIAIALLKTSFLGGRVLWGILEMHRRIPVRRQSLAAGVALYLLATDGFHDETDGREVAAQSLWSRVRCLLQAGESHLAVVS